MGMFDTVIFQMSCPNCGCEVRDWQTKNGPCILEKLKPYEVEEFYGECPFCKAWIDCDVDCHKRVVISDISITAKINTEKSHEAWNT